MHYANWSSSLSFTWRTHCLKNYSPYTYQHLPKIKNLNMSSTLLFRYKNFSDWEANRLLSEIDDIKNNRLTLVSPELFNDPYDCLVPFITDISEEEFKQILRPHIQEEVKDGLEMHSKQYEFTVSNRIFDKFCEILKNSISLNDFSKKFATWKPRQNGRYTIEEIRDCNDHATLVFMDLLLENMNIHLDINFGKKIQLTRNLARVACFSRDHNSMYFWSHYANSHEGICIEYSFKKDLDSFFKPAEVQYVELNSREILIKKFYSRTRLSDNFLVLTKSKDWESEKEVRVASINIREYFKNYTVLSLEELYEETKILQKLDGSTTNLDGRKNFEKCACGEFMYRFYSTPPQEKRDICAQIYCENCADKKGKQSILKLEYPFQFITKIYLGVRFDENSESAKLLIETAKSKNIPIYKMTLSKKDFNLEAVLHEDRKG